MEGDSTGEKDCGGKGFHGRYGTHVQRSLPKGGVAAGGEN